MKNAKRILLFALALVALTLVMSLSIFAEEATEPVACTHPVEAYDWNIVGCSQCGTLAVLDEGSTNVSSNLGYKIYYATSLGDLSKTDYDVIRLKNNISLASGDKITNANAIIDLGGNVLYRNGGWLGLRIVAAKGFVNGYVYKTNGGSQIMAVTSLGFMEDVTLAANSTKTNNATGLIMNTAGAYLGSMKNVTICAGVLNDLNSNNFDFVNVGTNGIYNHGIEATQGTIGSMENVKISTYGQAITSAAKIGTMTNCVFSADNIALNITTLQSEMVFVDCEIHSKNLAIYIANAVESTVEAPVSFEIGNTKFVTDGAVYDISSHIIDNEMFADLTSAKALVNGRLYTSLEEAVDALNASTEEVTTFALIGDLAVNSTIVVDKKVNFSFGGASYDVPVYGTNQVTHKTVTGYTVTSSVDVIFSVVEGGYLTISGDGRLEGTENAIVADGGVVVITAGTYVGYNPREFVSTESCVVNNEGVYTIAAEHDYDDEVGQDKTNYQVDGVCNNCGFVRGIFAVDNVYYNTLEEALAAAIEKGKQLVLAADIVLDGDVVWDFTGATFNFNALTVTVNGSLSIVGGTFTQDVSEYVSDEYCTYKNNKNLYEVVSDHEWGPAIGGSDATCTKPGIAIIACVKCGLETEEETSATLPHTYDWHIGGCPMCGTVAVPDVEGGKISTNLGYSVFFAANWSEINANVSASSTYKVIKLTADTTVPSGNNYAKVQNANIYIDLGGHSITSSVGLAPLYLYAADALVNGSIIHNYGRQALYVCNVNLIEDINIVMGGTYANNATAIYLASNASYAAGFEGSTGSYIGAMKNVTIDSKRDANGNYIDNIGLFNHGIEFSNAGSIIGDLENVRVYSRGQAITIMAKEIGTMTNCVFDGTNIGLNIGNLQCNINLVNCVVSSETLAVRIGGATSNELTFNFDENTAISSNGSVYYIPDNIKGNVGFESLTTAVALVNGVLYGTLEDALAAVLASTEEVTTFTLIGDLALDAPIEINKVVEFSFGGGTFKIPTTGDKTFTEMTAPGYTVTAPNGAFVVVEGGVLTITGDGTLVGNENAIVANGGDVVVEAGTYVGYNPVAFVDANACVANNDGTYTIAAHKYDDGVLSDKVTYGVDGVCNVCGFVRGSFAVDNVYYATIEEALAAALANGNQIVLAADIVIDGDSVWDLTGATFNFNSLTITVNGTLSIVGGTFTQDVSEYVSDEYCTYKNNKNLYVVVTPHTWTDATCTAPKTCTACGATEGEALGHSYFYACDKVCQVCGEESNPDATHTLVHVDAKAATCTENGNVEYWYCSDCGSAWTDEALTQVTNQRSVITPATGHSYFYPCDVVCMVCYEETNPDATHNIVHVEAVAATCTANGNVEYWYCSDCGSAWTDEALTQVTNQMSVRVPKTEHSYVEVERVPAEPGVAGSVTYTCLNCGDTYSEEIEALPEHTHTEVEIPAIPSTADANKVVTPGMTSGIKCSECGEVLVAPVVTDAGLTIDARSLNISESIKIIYKCYIPAGYSNVYMTFDFNGKVHTVTDYTVDGNGRYCFTFTGVTPQYMNINICATVYAENNDQVSAFVNPEYSVKTYCTNNLAKNLSASLNALLTDLLVYGEMLQYYVTTGTVDNPITDGVDLTNKSEFTPLDGSFDKRTESEETSEIAYWDTVSLNIASSVNISFKFYATNIEGLEVKVTVKNRTTTYNASDLELDSKGRYVVLFTNVTAVEFDEVVTAEFYVNGEKIDGTMTYSVNSYIQRYQDYSNVKLTNFLKALYNYGLSAYKYVNKGADYQH